jgi:mannose-6-phosphate isomerase-like protein (cupin superfamily)
MADITSPRLLYAKGSLFLLTGALAAGLLIVELPAWRTVLLLAIAVWAFARAYYFAFYVIQHYIDPGFRFAGLWAFTQYLLRRPAEKAPLVTERLAPEAALAELPAAGREFVTVFRHGTLEVEVYKPDRIDRQQPHSRDEVYVVIRGTGVFTCGDVRQPFGPGEVLFAPAGVEHRFEDFTDDFATWVFFYGPEGGEAGP